MTDPVQEAIAELVFADQLVDEHELHTIEAHDWLTAYLRQRQLDMAAFSTRLMTAHDDPAVDAQALQQLLPVDREALFELLVDLLAIDGHADPRETEALARLAEKLGLPPRPLEQLLQEAAPRIALIRERSASLSSGRNSRNFFGFSMPWNPSLLSELSQSPHNAETRR